MSNMPRFCLFVFVTGVLFLIPRNKTNLCNQARSSVLPFYVCKQSLFPGHKNVKLLCQVFSYICEWLFGFDSYEKC